MVAQATSDGDEEQALLAVPAHRLYTTQDQGGDGPENDKTTWLSSEPQSPTAPPSNAWQWYATVLDRYPLLVKAITAFFILGLGDAAAQGVEHLQPQAAAAATSFDWWRALRFGSFGFLGAPWAHYYFMFLDKFFPPTEKPFTSTTAIKLFIDQGIQAPSLLAFIISALAILKGTGFLGVWTDLQAHYMNTLIANWILWIPASLINLAFIHPQYRVLYVNLVFFFWTILLSILVNGK